jgi:hypothetical protein
MRRSLPLFEASTVRAVLQRNKRRNKLRIPDSFTGDVLTMTNEVLTMTHAQYNSTDPHPGRRVAVLDTEMSYVDSGQAEGRSFPDATTRARTCALSPTATASSGAK